MDNMKAKARHLYKLIAGSILSLLGFSSCENILEPVVEYGTPHATFKVIGEVKAADSSKPIEGIVVKVSRDDSYRYHWFEHKFLSDKDGKVNGEFNEWPSDENLMLTFEDIDGEENGGLFAPDTLRAKDLRIEFTENKNSHWNKGDYTISFDAKLKKAPKQ